MTIVKRFLFCTAASVVMLAGAHAADLPVKAGKIEYVKVCSLYGAGFYYIPGTDTCVRIGGAMNILTTFNGNPFDGPMWQGGPGGANSYNRNYFQTLERFYLNIDTRTQTEYGILRTYANLLFDFIPGRENIAGGIIENDFLFLQFAGFTFGKAVSMFDPQWAVSKPTISAGFFAGSNNVTGLPMLAYTATFGNGLDATISLEDAQPYRSAGVVDTSQQFLGPFGAAVTNFGTTSNTFLGNAQAGDHVPDVVANLRYDQAWGTLHFGAAAHEVHGTYYNPSDSSTGKPDATWGYAVTGAFELKNLPTGNGDSLKVLGAWAHGAAKYIFGGTIDRNGAGRFGKVGSSDQPGTAGSMAFGYVLDGVYAGPGSSIQLSDSWGITAFYEHYWNPAWRTSLFATYDHISYGSSGDAVLLAAANAGRLSTGLTNATGSFAFGTFQAGTRTAWTPVNNLTLSAEFLYTRLDQNLNGTFTSTAAAVPGYPAGSKFLLKDQNLFNGAVSILRSY